MRPFALEDTIMYHHHHHHQYEHPVSGHMVMMPLPAAPPVASRQLQHSYQHSQETLQGCDSQLSTLRNSLTRFKELNERYQLERQNSSSWGKGSSPTNSFTIGNHSNDTPLLEEVHQHNNIMATTTTKPSFTAAPVVPLHKQHRRGSADTLPTLCSSRSNASNGTFESLSTSGSSRRLVQALPEDDLAPPPPPAARSVSFGTVQVLNGQDRTEPVLSLADFESKRKQEQERELKLDEYHFMIQHGSFEHSSPRSQRRKQQKQTLDASKLRIPKKASHCVITTSARIPLPHEEHHQAASLPSKPPQRKRAMLRKSSSSRTLGSSSMSNNNGSRLQSFFGFGSSKKNNAKGGAAERSSSFKTRPRMNKAASLDYIYTKQHKQ